MFYTCAWYSYQVNEIVVILMADVRADKWFSDACSKEPKNSFNCRKRLRSLDDLNITKFTAASPFETISKD